LALLLTCVPLCAADPMPDLRDIRTGSAIPDEGYCDQPFVVVLPDGVRPGESSTWLCVLTTGRGKEGDPGQHVVATRSTDQGRTWSPLVDIEPADGPEASWVVPLLTPSGRVYVFYDYNGDRVDTLAGRKIRADMLGWYVYKFSDDGGRTWAAERYRLPMRLTACDRANQWQGRVQVFWGVAKPVVSGGAAYLAFTKLGKYMLDEGEGWVYRSDNILAEKDPAKLRWDLLPEGDRGIRLPEFGSIQEEHNLVPLSDGSLYCVYRTTMGLVAESVSRDGGRTWSTPRPAAYADGRPIKNPRANPRVFRTAEGRYLLWFHHNGTKSFENRNPAWLAGGIEKDGRILWSEPEVLLYDPDPKTRMSYPDFIEQGGRFWVTETQKTAARVHEIDRALLDGLWGQFENRAAASRGLVLDLPAEKCGAAATVALPRLPDLATGGGFSLDLRLRAENLDADRAIFDTRGDGGRGLAVTLTRQGTVRLDLSDGRAQAAWESDAGLVRPGRWHHVTATVDGGPKIVTFMVDGRLCDGGETRPFGWGRFDAALGEVNGKPQATLPADSALRVGGLRVYDRYLRTSEAVGNARAGG
jgi:hypothetical protein